MGVTAYSKQPAFFPLSNVAQHNLSPNWLNFKGCQLSCQRGLRVGYSFDSSVWYYLISLAKASDITERGVESDKIYRVVVLTSGEVLPPYTPK